MNRKSAIIRLVSYSIVALLLIVLLVLGIINGPFWTGLSCGGINIGGYYYKDADKYSVGEFTLDEDISSISVDWIAGNVKFVVTDKENLYVDETDVEDEENELRYRVVKGTLMIKFKKSEGFSYGNDVKKDLTIYVPEEMAKKMAVVEIQSVSAGVDIEYCYITDLNIETVSGQVNASNVILGSVDVESVSAKVSISGEVDKINAESVSGKIDITSSKQLSSIDMESVSGDITVSMPEGDGFTAEMESVSGDMNIDFEVTTKEDVRINGDGSAKYSFETVSGDASLKKID